MPPKSSFDDIVLAECCSPSTTNTFSPTFGKYLHSENISNKVQFIKRFRRRENSALINNTNSVNTGSEESFSNITKDVEDGQNFDPPTCLEDNDDKEKECYGNRSEYSESDIEGLDPIQNLSSSSSLIKLLFGASGIYSAYLFYGHIQEDLFLYESPTSGEKFRFAWLLQTIESFVIVTLGLIMMRFVKSDINSLPKLQFFQSGVSQVLSKTFTSLALAAGLSFPVCTLAKSAKIVPVMIGQIVLGGASKYTIRDYAFAILLVTGTALLSMNTGRSHTNSSQSNSTTAGTLWIGASLIMDGFTAGLQKRIQKETTHSPPTTLDFLLLTNISMGFIAFVVSLLLPQSSATTMTNSNELFTGIQFLVENPPCLKMVTILCCCSAIGQSFIFYIIAQFDPLVCSTITTTRKILSVLWSILMKGHIVSLQGQLGILLAVSGLMLEVHGKSGKVSTTKNIPSSRSNIDDSRSDTSVLNKWGHSSKDSTDISLPPISTNTKSILYTK